MWLTRYVRKTSDLQKMVGNFTDKSEYAVMGRDHVYMDTLLTRTYASMSSY